MNRKDIGKLGVRWGEVAEVIRKSAAAVGANDFCQPIKPYLRYHDPANRIIAMPAYVGGEFNASGIKWIASFPGNVGKGLPRAHSVTILNDALTGVPLCLLNTPLISGIRTAGVTALMVSEWLKLRPAKSSLNVGITGFGPIGQMHLDMLLGMLGRRLNRVWLYDPKRIDKNQLPEPLKDRVCVCDGWEEAYVDSDIFITCTVSKAPYIDRQPKKGSLQLNVSLRDYKPEIMHHVDLMVVDAWEEVCREGTDIEKMHKQLGLQRENTVSLADLVTGGGPQGLAEDQIVMFNPMGMAVFDVAIGNYYFQQALRNGVGLRLED